MTAKPGSRCSTPRVGTYARLIRLPEIHLLRPGFPGRPLVPCPKVLPETPDQIE